MTSPCKFGQVALISVPPAIVLFFLRERHRTGILSGKVLKIIYHHICDLATLEYFLHISREEDLSINLIHLFP